MKKIFLGLGIFFLGLFLFSKPVSAQSCIAHGGLCHPTIPCCSPDSCFSGYCLTSTPPIVTPVPTSVPSGSKDVLCDGGKGINTAIGCLHVLDSSNTFLSELLRWATGIGGGIAFILMLYAGFMIMTASGNPDRIQAGKELLMSAIGGLILLVLSIFILKLIGVDILGLCKFGFGPSC